MMKMLTLAQDITPTLGREPVIRKMTIKATRPALTDMRFKGDAWIVRDGGVAAVCLGDYALGQVQSTSLDVPSLNRALSQVRLGQARRNHVRRLQRP